MKQDSDSQEVIKSVSRLFIFKGNNSKSFVHALTIVIPRES